MASFLAELMASGRAQLPVRKSSEIGQHMVSEPREVVETGLKLWWFIGIYRDLVVEICWNLLKVWVFYKFMDFLMGFMGVLIGVYGCFEWVIKVEGAVTSQFYKFVMLSISASHLTDFDCWVANTPPHRVGGEQVGSQLRKRWPPSSWRSGVFHGFHEGRWLRGVTQHGLYGSKVLNWITIP